MLNPELVKILLAGQQKNESGTEFAGRIQLSIATAPILTLDEIDNSITAIGGGVDINVPVVVVDPIVTIDSINAAIQKHNTEIQRMQAINTKIIEGLVALIAVGATAASGGGFMALLPLAAELLVLLQSSSSRIQ